MLLWVKNVVWLLGFVLWLTSMLLSLYAHYGGPASLQFSEPCGKIPSLSAANVCENIFTMHALYLFLSLSLSLGPRGDELLYLSARNSFNGYLFWLSQQPATTLTVVSGSLNSLLHMYNSDRICFGSLSSLLQL